METEANLQDNSGLEKLHRSVLTTLPLGMDVIARVLVKDGTITDEDLYLRLATEGGERWELFSEYVEALRAEQAENTEDQPLAIINITVSVRAPAL